MKKEEECYLSTTFLLNKISSTLTLVQKKKSICPNRPPQHTVDKTQWLRMSFLLFMGQGKWRGMFL